MRHRYAFGPAGGAGGVDDVGQVVRTQRPNPVSIADRARRQRGGSLLGCLEVLRVDDHARLAVGDQVFDPLDRVGRVDRQVCRTGFEHGEHRDDEFHRAGHLQANQVLGADPLPDQPARQPVTPDVELVVAQFGVIGDHRDRLGCGGGRIEQRNHRGRGGGDKLAL